MKSVIDIKDVGYSYQNKEEVLKGLDVSIPEGKKIALLGANGAGKSTMMLLLNGVLKPSKGELLYHGKPYNYKRKGLRELRQKVGILFQEPDSQIIAPTVYEEVAFGLTNLGFDKESVREKTASVLECFYLTEIQYKNPHHLSVGQKKRVCFASILAMAPDVIVADEPTSGLDHQYSQQMFKEFDFLNDKGKTIIISTHDMNQAYEWADYVIVLHEGRVLKSGMTDEVFQDVEVLAQAGLPQPLLLQIAQSMGITELPQNMEALKQLIKQKV